MTDATVVPPTAGLRIEKRCCSMYFRRAPRLCADTAPPPPTCPATQPPLP